MSDTSPTGIWRPLRRTLIPWLRGWTAKRWDHTPIFGHGYQAIASDHTAWKAQKFGSATSSSTPKFPDASGITSRYLSGVTTRFYGWWGFA